MRQYGIGVAQRVPDGEQAGGPGLTGKCEGVLQTTHRQDVSNRFHALWVGPPHEQRNAFNRSLEDALMHHGLEFGNTGRHSEHHREGAVVPRKGREAHVAEIPTRPQNPWPIGQRVARADPVIAAVVDDAALTALQRRKRDALLLEPTPHRRTTAHRVDHKVRGDRATVHIHSRDASRRESNPSRGNSRQHLDPRLRQHCPAQCPLDQGPPDPHELQHAVGGLDFPRQLSPSIDVVSAFAYQ